MGCGSLTSWIISSKPLFKESLICLLMLWNALLKSEVPKRTSVEFLQKSVAHELQLLQYGSAGGRGCRSKNSNTDIGGNINADNNSNNKVGNNGGAVIYAIRKRLYSRLKDIGFIDNDNCDAQRQSSPLLNIGTVLVREWHGETHKVIIEADGYYYRDQHYKSWG